MERETLEMLIRAHQAEVFRYLRYLGADTHTGEDLVQDTFIAAYKAKKQPDYKDERQRCAWLRGIARNLFFNECRKRKKEPMALEHEHLELMESAWVSDFLGDGDGYDYLEALRGCMDRLSERHRKILNDRYRENLPRREMAARYGLRENSVKSLLRRIRTGLGECIQRRLGLGGGSS